MAIDDTQNSEAWAYDIDKQARSIGECFDEDSINNSIENILMTNRGERVFLPYFGSPLSLVVFETLDNSNGERLLDEIIDTIKQYEPRVTVIAQRVQLNILTDQQAITLVIPYKINRTGLLGTFSRKITV